MGLAKGKDIESRFVRYVEGLVSVIGHADRAGPLHDYFLGLVLPGERKSVEPMAAITAPERTAAQHQSLLHFVGAGGWSDDAVLGEVREMVLPKIERSGPIEAWIIDDTSYPKKGRHSVGVSHQYCGQLGKQANCQVAVTLSLANHDASLPVAYRLYLPKAWAEDDERRRKAKVPEDIVFKTKPEIALDHIRWAHVIGPPVPPEEEPAVVHTPRDDPSQDRAAAHRGSAFELQAGPGTGKTRTLVKRVLSLLRDGVDPASILVLTFSNRAAGELSERLVSVVPEQAPRIWIGTFHAFGLDLIRRYHDKLGLPPDPALFDRSRAIEVLEEVLPTLPLVHYRNLWDPALVLRDIVGAISRAKDELVDASQYRALAQAHWDRETDPENKEGAAKALEVAQVYKIYQETLRSCRSVDFGDLIMRPTLLIEADEAVLTAARLRHRHVLVDEYQDVNRASARLLLAVAGDGSRLWVGAML